MSLMKINELQSLSKLFIYPVYWINLEKSKNRKNYMIKELNKLNIRHFRVGAIDGKKIKHQEYYWKHPSDFNISSRTVEHNTLG